MHVNKLFIFSALLSLSSLNALDAQRPLPIKDSSGRQLCTTITQAQSVRFDRCRTNEVMTGIRSLDPITVYCTTILANCLNRNSIEETKDGVSTSQSDTH